MGNKLYVGNLPYQMRDSDLEQAFGQFGQVTSAKVMMERETGRSKGFGFDEMGSDADAQAAINRMNGQPQGGRRPAGRSPHPPPTVATHMLQPSSRKRCHSSWKAGVLSLIHEPAA